MAKKLFRVTFSVDLMVRAESAEDAESQVVCGSIDWSDEIRNGDASAREITKVSELSEDEAGSYPWETTQVPQTCREYIKDPHETD